MLTPQTLRAMIGKTITLNFRSTLFASKVLDFPLKSLFYYVSREMFHVKTLIFGTPGFEPGLHAPKACMLPLHHVPTLI